jgi:hypothetical protein
MNRHKFFEGRSIVIATKHQKQNAMAALLEKELGVTCIVPENLDTDLLGTFSGEIERELSPIDAAKKKCMLAMELTNTDLAISSEGSFGAHPLLYFLPADDEVLAFIDQKNGLEIAVREISTKTNYNAKEVSSEEDLLAFAQSVQFPSHALILKDKKDGFTSIAKGIVNTKELLETFAKFKQSNETVYAETDMRAHLNPSRMQVIEETTEKLIKKIKTACPSCNTPGFGIKNSIPGLPCENCKTPSKSTLYHVYACQKCNHTYEAYFPNGKQQEDPTYCDRCNP